jgi:hypothetical protein
MKEQSIAVQMIRLFTEFPCAGTNDANFGLDIPGELSKASYDLIVGHIEFRRRCMNQGFDNLLELLKMHYDAMQSIRKINPETGEPIAKE